eukprot:TRINITY_DN2525_c0_g2_i4.p1 TRINITY_DN2525_c0_g2~~TRINITY_DN2525_c0_g2_i4.p1  ORF type:complete len:767 (-),score=201.04 TRINITY_DN2525_c0_g2_i4:39-2339(-)
MASSQSVEGTTLLTPIVVGTAVVFVPHLIAVGLNHVKRVRRTASSSLSSATSHRISKPPTNEIRGHHRHQHDQIDDAEDTTETTEDLDTSTLSVPSLADDLEFECIDESASEREKRFYRLPDGFQVKIINDETECESEMRQLLDSAAGAGDDADVRLLGLDVEWKPNTKSRKHYVSLLQIATENCCYLIRLCKFKGFENADRTNILPPALEELLASPRFVKAGVAIYSDARKLYSDFGVTLKGCVDLQSVVSQKKELHELYATRGGTSLAALCASVLGSPLKKAHWIRCSDWEAAELLQEQITYAALDAYAGHQILATLINKHPDQASSSSSSSSSSTSSSSTSPSDVEADRNQQRQTIKSWCYHFIDRRPVTVNTNSSATSKPKKAISLPTRSTSSKRQPQRKSDLFYNCRILSPSNELIACCDKKKLDWYLTRNLAEEVTDNPPTIKLKFEPRGKGHAGDLFHLATKYNICVRCGKGTDFSKHSVVPHIYRTHFPVEIKGYNNHDTVLLCLPCAQLAFESAEQLKKTISEETGIPLAKGATRYNQYGEHRELARVKGLARSLRKHYNGSAILKKEREEELLQELRNYFKKEDITMKDITEACAFEIKTPLSDSERNHGAGVVAQLKTLEDKEKFVQRWRKHFLDSLEPKFMPEHWSITHPLLNPHGTRTKKVREEREAMLRNQQLLSSASTSASTPVFSSSSSYPPLEDLSIGGEKTSGSDSEEGEQGLAEGDDEGDDDDEGDYRQDKNSDNDSNNDSNPEDLN